MDDGTKVTDKATEKLEKQIEKVYKEAEQDIKDKMQDFTKKFKVKHQKYLNKLKSGEITQEDYNAWINGQIFQQKQWEAKKHQIQNVIANSNQIALKMINGETANVFGANANFMHYDLEHTAGVDFGFGIYDSATVVNIIKNNPQSLPKWKIDQQKDYTWNNKKVNNAVTQGVIQGESLDKISERVAKSLTTQNSNLMKTFARTAMTGAQNSGRFYSIMEAKSMGINVLKMWMATLDSHTRDSHADIDGETQKVGDQWHQYLYKFSNGCRYPGDPLGPAAEVYNCRCTLVEEFEDYPSKYQRYDNIEGKPIDNMTYKEWAKKKTQSAELTAAQTKLQDLQDKVNQTADIDKVFTGIWKNQNVTYEDWEDKKDSIQGKLDYYDQQLSKVEDQLVKDYCEGDYQTYEIMQKYKDDLQGLLKDQDAMDYIQNNLLYDKSDVIDTWTSLYGQGGNPFLNTLEKLQENKQNLLEFKLHGEGYSKLLKDLADAKKDVKVLSATTYTNGFDPNAYSQARKDAAIWAKSPEEADKFLRGTCGEVWRNATDAEKAAIYEYTQSYHKFNEPLRGYEYGTSRYLGVGNTDLNAGSARNGNKLNAMTDIISRSTYNEDMWLNRGCRFSGMDKFFQCDMNLLQHGTQEQLENALLGKVVTDYGFMSCGSSKGTGFSGDIKLNIYAPSGTQMMYVEPFSAFGNGSGISWNGSSTQSWFGSELETILQQGTQFRVTKIDRKNEYSTIFVDIEVIDQSNVQRWER